MSTRNTLIRAMHDVGAAAWFGGALMGAVALNGASRDVQDPTERAKVASTGWARWSPVAATAIGTHAVGGLGLVVANRRRVRGQEGVGANTISKTALTLAAMGTTAYSGVLGAQLLQAGPVDTDGGTVPNAGTPDAVATKQQQLRVLQWVTPVLVGLVIVLGAQQGEQQRSSQILKGVAAKAVRGSARRSGRS
jgi:hypothetical protein